MDTAGPYKCVYTLDRFLVVWDGPLSQTESCWHIIKTQARGRRVNVGPRLSEHERHGHRHQEALGNPEGVGGLAGSPKLATPAPIIWDLRCPFSRSPIHLSLPRHCVNSFLS